MKKKKRALFEGPAKVFRDAGWGQNRGGMLDMRNIEGGIRDKNFLAGSGYAISIGGMRDSFEIDSGMRDLNSK